MDLVILENYQRSLLETIFFFQFIIRLVNSVVEDSGERKGKRSGEKKSDSGAMELLFSNFEELQLRLR